MNIKQVLEEVNISPRRLQYIAATGFLTDFAIHTGRGSLRYFSDRNVDEVRIVNSLIEIGLSTRSIFEVLRNVDFDFKSSINVKLGEWTLVKDFRK